MLQNPSKNNGYSVETSQKSEGFRRNTGGIWSKSIFLLCENVVTLQRQKTKTLALQSELLIFKK